MTRYARSDARAWTRASMRGYFAVLYTPFAADGSIDERGLRHNVEATLALPGVGGLSVHSIHQEFWTLTLEERKRVTEVVLEAVGGRKPVVVGVNDTAIANIVELARHASAAGADAVMIWPSYYGQRTAEGVKAFYEQIAAQIDIGFFVYSTTLSELGFYLTPAMVDSLLGIEHLCGVQSTTLNFPSYAAMMERVGDRIAVVGSLEEFFLFGRMVFPERVADFTLGSSRPVFMQSQARPHCGEFIAAALRNDFAAASAKLRDIVRIAELLQSRYFGQGFHHVPLFKALSEQMGLVGGAVRPPLSAPDPREVQECVAVLRENGLVA